jgi:molybdopterin-containing oxidoreductase family membrane subunit
VRRNVAAMFALSILVNIGMWLERFILIVSPLSYKQPFVFTWVENYVPRPIEYVLSVAFLALVGLGVLLFAKLFPIVPIWDVKEGQVVREQIKVGRVEVPAAIRE